MSSGVTGTPITETNGAVAARRGRSNGKPQRPRFLFYCHDTMGLGHLRRTLLLAEGLKSRWPDSSCLILTGSASVQRFSIPAGIDYIKLPCVKKLANEQYSPRFLDIEFAEVWKMREQIILLTAASFQPDLFFVDNVPGGMKKEVLSTLKFLRGASRCRGIFLVLRDVLDARNRVVDFWKDDGIFQVLEDFYHRVLVFGEPSVLDPSKEYQFPTDLQEKVRFCGYIPRPADESPVEPLRHRRNENGEKLVLVTVGGGGDGRCVIESYLQALPELEKAARIQSRIVVGPDADAELLDVLKARHRHDSVEFIDFCSNLTAEMAAADAVVSMAGYNTVSELIWLGKQCVVIPRIHPRVEQLIRSRRLQQMGLLKMLHPSKLTPTRLANAVMSCLNHPGTSSSKRLGFEALERLPREVASYLGIPTSEHEDTGRPVTS